MCGSGLPLLTDPRLAPPPPLSSPHCHLPGYHSGLVPIPTLPATRNLVTDFGAVGDGVTDATSALQTALSTMNSGVLYIPPGK